MALRDTNIDRLRDGMVDVAIVGGGINGAVTAASLAGRGASVALIDRADFGSETSQESSNLVWGGFKYLENYELPLVYKLCESRNRLMKAYPDNVAELSFLAALDDSSPYPPWFAALGATAYWGIGKFRTRPPKLHSAEAIKKTEPVIDTDGVRGGIEYRDAYLRDNDARFVFGFVRSAIEAGAAVANYVDLVDAQRSDGHWQLGLADLESGERLELKARTIVNAAGPYVDGLNSAWGVTTEHRIVYSKGIHLIVPRLTTTEHQRVLAFFDDSGRLFYVIPMGIRSVIGTTDTRTDDPRAGVTDDDRAFLLDQINKRLDLPKPLTTDDVIAERCGVRPLVVPNSGGDRTDVDWTSLSRKHEIEVDRARSVITIFGGKLTDCLNVGEEVADAVEDLGLPLEKDTGTWYGEPTSETRDVFYRQARLMRLDDLRVRPDVEPLSDRLWRRYGRRAFAMLEAIRSDPSMGEDIFGGTDYLRVELYLAASTEMVTRLEDFMRRRSKIEQVVPNADLGDTEGLREVCDILFGDEAEAKLNEFLAGPYGQPGPGQSVAAPSAAHTSDVRSD
ncbi:MAG: FAD-dependent oxidoreductase [Candidatus Microthrix sp.]|nr:FAD-dependent oxidoreductase [Candidatus Microthrix sp.]